MNSVSILNIGFLNSRSGLLYKTDKKSETLTSFSVSSIEQISLEFMGVTI